MLWVFTQNKNSLMNVKEVTVKGRYIEGVVDRGFFNEWSGTLGKYESNERALEILKQISMKIEEGNGSSATFTMPEK
ncbi:hypothetical protein D1B31_05105 [Neobacillus notoginsengisoli]|uniref:Uncharacterized protein n=1 Tax=Neobacillus notoginsengisoli TaxID=1578198 RepID=A0A417YWQ8_9BACI|nr:hypothetical protein [Neobacillus notoginsengisoli]RHW42023.1 hypothetical protein D1B31_05105 [Neobacillus notoginsengisoli]